jgi:Fis family transcriptional regulator
VEGPLLSCVLQHTGNNQSRAAQMLGLNRGTLRKKMRRYRLL